MATATTEILSETEPETETEFPPHRMTIDRYERLIESGVYGPEDKVFLWHGRLVEKMGQGRPHVISVMGLYDLLRPIIPEGYHAEMESPIAVGDDSMPEPDWVVLRGAARDYQKRAPTSQQVILIVEVSDSSVVQDFGTKLRAYATQGIPIYWIVHIPKARIVVHIDPTGPSETPGYQKRREYGPEEVIPVVLDGREVGRIAVRDILP